jgi:hypothetical protein
LDDNGYALTFNPASPGTPTPLDLDDTDRGLALACPSTSECVAVDDEGEETTFDPSSSSSSALVEIDPSGVLKAVACPTTSQCTAVGGNGAEVTFNPASPGTPMGGDVAGPNELWAITCPSSTQCVAVGENGIEATFNPETAASTSEPGVHAGGYGGTMTGVSCPSASECIAVESGGAAVTFSPESPGTATSDGISTVAVEDSISCPASGECVAAGNPDAVGAGSVVVGFEPVPAALAQPVISGVTTEGQTLSASGGSWSNEPSAYSYQWERCEGPGLPTCNAIPGATAQTYTLTEVDIGTTLQLVETASNAGGSSTPSTSPATGQVVSDLGSPSFGIGSVSDYGVIVDVGCLGTDAQCPVTVTLTITETSERGKVIAVSAGAHARDRRHTTKRTVELGHASATLASGGGIYAIPVSLDSAGQQLVKQRHKLPVEVTVTATGFAETFTSTGPVMGTRTFRVGAQTVTFHQPKPKRK